jgi:hypothetical protein
MQRGQGVTDILRPGGFFRAGPVNLSSKLLDALLRLRQPGFPVVNSGLYLDEALVAARPAERPVTTKHVAVDGHRPGGRQLGQQSTCPGQVVNHRDAL